MVKMHTKKKRKFDLASHQSHSLKPKTKARPKTFKTEESAATWAKANGVSKYTLKSVKKDKKFQIVTE